MTANFKAALKSCFDSAHNLYHQKVEETKAQSILKQVETVKGPLAKSVAKRCDAYASEVFGRKYYSPWLYVYSAVFGTFEEGWIPKNFYEGVLHDKICGHYMGVAGLKPLNRAIFRSDCFPDLAGYANGSFFNAGYQHVAPEQVEGILFRENEKVVFKLDDSHDGLDVFILDRLSFDLERIRELGNGIFQSFIKQHELFNAFANRSVATLRLTTCMDDQGAVTPRACHLRLGTGSDTHVQTPTQIRVPIRLESGRFFDVGYSSHWLEIDAHPTSGEAFSGKAIPSFQACVDLVVELHRKVPFVRCVGWDVAVDAMGQPRIMEWNIGYNGIGFDQASQGPCFADLHWERYRPVGRDRLKVFF